MSKTIFLVLASAVSLVAAGGARSDPAVSDNLKEIDAFTFGTDAYPEAKNDDEAKRLDAIFDGIVSLKDAVPVPEPVAAPAVDAVRDDMDRATAQPAPVKVIGHDDALIVANNAGASAYDPPIPGTPGPFDGAPVPRAPDSPDVDYQDPAEIGGETATNVASPPSDATLDAGKVDATSGLDQSGTITDTGSNGGATKAGRAARTPKAA